MNVERIKDFIRVMRKVEKLDLEQGHEHFDINVWGCELKDDGEARCGTVACALGWLATTPKARAAGLINLGYTIQYNRENTYPIYDEAAGAEYLDIPVEVARTLFFDTYYCPVESNVKPSHVIGKLEHLLKLGPEEYLNLHIDLWNKARDEKYGEFA